MTFLSDLEQAYNKLLQQNYILTQQLEQAKNTIEELKNSNKQNAKK